MSEIDLKRFSLNRSSCSRTSRPTRSRKSSSKPRLATYEGNEAILETGDEGHAIGAVISGHAEISMTDNTGTRSGNRPARSRRPGVMSLFTGDRIVADVIAGNRCFVLMIPQEVFNSPS